MLGQDWAQLGYYILLLVVIGGAMLFELAGRGGRALRQIVLWVVIFTGAIFAADLWLDWSEPQQQVLEGGRVEIPISRDGHFHLTATLNGQQVRMVVDTGASTVALSREDAARIGIDTGQIAFVGTAMTANGRVRTAPVRINEFAIGDIVDRDVPAMVIEGACRARFWACPICAVSPAWASRAICWCWSAEAAAGSRRNATLCRIPPAICDFGRVPRKTPFHFSFLRRPGSSAMPGHIRSRSERVRGRWPVCAPWGGIRSIRRR